LLLHRRFLRRALRVIGAAAGCEAGRAAFVAPAGSIARRAGAY